MALVYLVYDAQGTHRDLGRQHGEQCRARIQGFLDYLGKLLKLSRPALRERALRFLPLVARRFRAFHASFLPRR